MKKVTIITSILTVAAIGATLFQLHVYNQQIRQTLETEIDHIRPAMARTELLAEGRQHAITELQSELKVLTNRPADQAKAGNT